MGGCRTLSQAAHTDVLDSQKIIDPVLRAFAADARLFDAAKRCDLRRKKTAVDADDALLKCFRHAPRAPDVPAIEVACEPDLGVVGKPHSLFLGLKAKQRRHRPEGLLVGYL